ncbi:MAG: terminase family protein [Desulfovibrio sp.]|uniref:terminase large subunit domain-containing protein n=1 Tax=Desulfovibrio sp. TaxID=885 RepID=UPI0025837293|nr:terminase family protein [Desulfovibrio sp.]MCD7984142.1 terminase family protein [Desulfovibrio sp.]
MAGVSRIVIPYTPRYPAVHATLETHRFCVLVAHRRFGKTVLAVNHLLKRALCCPLARGSYAYVAPFRNQAKAVAWDYLKHYSAPVPGRAVNESELSVSLPNGAGIRIFGADNPDALRGLYFDGVVLDEVAQMKPQVWEEIIQPALADRRGWTLFIGTPKGVNLFSELYGRARREEAAGNPDWAALCFRVDETGALPADEVERLRRELSDNAWRQEMLCDFTAAGDDVLIPIDLVSEAAGRQSYTEADIRHAPVVLGVDVARFGSDATVIFRRQGLAAFPPLALRGADNMTAADRLAQEIVTHKPAGVFIDAGQGQGVIDRVRQLGHAVSEVHFGGRALRHDIHANRRMEMWAGLRDWLRAGGSIPDDPALKSDLSTPVYGFDAAGRMLLESKDKIRERLGRSPDLADALALTFAAPVAPPGHVRRKARTEYDLFGERLS